MPNIRYSTTEEVPKKSKLHINFTKRNYSAEFAVLQFRDPDTNQFVLYAPAFAISGYGESYDKADEMFKESFNAFFDFIFRNPREKVNLELVKLGWKIKPFFNKDFTREEKVEPDFYKQYNVNPADVTHLLAASPAR